VNNDIIQETVRKVDEIYKSLTFYIHGVERLIPHDMAVGKCWGKLENI
jgi:hypothetical protein